MNYLPYYAIPVCRMRQNFRLNMIKCFHLNQVVLEIPRRKGKLYLSEIDHNY